jgi:polysaccharide pyruvyl transferase WcaK-like protein
MTIHSIHNFGSVFQAVSLQEFLIRNGYDVQIVDYRPQYFNSGRNKLKTFLGRFLNYGAFIKRKSKFDAFISRYMLLTDKCYKNFDELNELNRKADVYIAGGDQLWNDYHFSGRDSAFKLTFATEGTKLAFGTSMGRDNYTSDEIYKLVSMVQDFRFIGLREKSSVQFLKSGGFENVEHVVDPVLLLDKTFFKSVAIKPKIEKYALLYLVDKSLLLDAAVGYISDKLGLKIVHVCGFRKKCKCDYFLKDPGPEEILGLLVNAEFVISASFHATLFSILFNKNFISLLPHENTNARITELLELVGLKHRIITSEKGLDVIVEPTNFEKTNKIIQEFSKNSKDKLIEVLNNIMSERK